jgi:ABC-2 type transport system ATP-binding protein
MVMVDVQNVWKRYDTTLAVAGISLSIERGALLGLIGPNGAGKTTLMKMVATLNKPDRGTVRIMGRDVRVAVATIRRRLGYMPAEFGKMPDMTVHEYLSFFGAAAGIPRVERARRVADVLELVDLVDRKDSLVSAGSTGIKQRILIAKTLVHDPDLLVLDEPAAGLDPRARIEIREILRELNRLGKTIVVSSHILADLEEICDSVAIIEHGRLVTYGGITALTDALRGRSTSHAWHVRVPGDQVAQAHEVLLTLPDVEGVGVEEEGLRFRTTAKDANFALRALLDHDVVIQRWSEEGPRLEDVFMKETEGTIQ